MSSAYDSLDHHLAQAGDFSAAAIPMGMLLTWCVNLQLISPTVLQAQEDLILRLRFQEAQGSELLTACGGDLNREMFNAEGQRFLDNFYPGYMTFFEEVFDAEPYSVHENWSNYQVLAKALTKIYMQGAKAEAGGGLLKKLAHWLKG